MELIDVTPFHLKSWRYFFKYRQDFKKYRQDFGTIPSLLQTASIEFHRASTELHRGSIAYQNSLFGKHKVLNFSETGLYRNEDDEEPKRE